jgi:hypothetical protein
MRSQHMSTRRSISHANCSCSKPHSARTILLQLQLCAQSAPSYHAQPFISLFAATALLLQILKKAVTMREEFLGQFSLQAKNRMDPNYGLKDEKV